MFVECLEEMKDEAHNLDEEAGKRNQNTSCNFSSKFNTINLTD